MRAVIDDRHVMVGTDKEFFATGMRNGGGAQHEGTMRDPVRRLGVPPVAKTVHEACIDRA